MRLDRLSGKEKDITPTKLKGKPDAETLDVLKDIVVEMHKTMLVADTLMRS